MSDGRWSWGDPSPHDDRPYGCSQCATPLRLENVYSVSPSNKGLVVRHYCPTIRSDVEATYPYSYPSLALLFIGRVPQLPWMSPDGNLVMERTVLAFTWELTQIQSCDELLLFMRGSIHEDEKIRQEFRAKWPRAYDA